MRFSRNFKIVVVVILLNMVFTSIPGINATPSVKRIKAVQMSDLGYTSKVIERNDGAKIANVYEKGKLVATAMLDKKEEKLKVVSRENTKVFSQKFDIKEINELKKIVSNGFNKKGKYRYVTTHRGTVRIAYLAKAVIVATILVIAPEISLLRIASLVSAIIQAKANRIRYTVDIYMYNKKREYHFKKVFKFYKRKTNKKLGPTIVTYNVVHRR